MTIEKEEKQRQAYHSHSGAKPWIEGGFTHAIKPARRPFDIASGKS
jgi:hypothetical protein